jgi:hypothetical protein
MMPGDAIRPVESGCHWLMGWRMYGDVPVDAIVAGLTDPATRPDEMANVVTALQPEREAAVKALRKAAAAQTKLPKTGASSPGVPSRPCIWAMCRSPKRCCRRFPLPLTSPPPPEIPDLRAGFEQQLTQLSQLPPEEQSTDENRLQRATACITSTDIDEALKDLNALAEQESPGWRVLLTQAICLASTGDEDAARAAMNA